MKILIYGPVSSGKSFLKKELLKKYPNAEIQTLQVKNQDHFDLIYKSIVPKHYFFNYIRLDFLNQNCFFLSLTYFIKKEKK